MKNLPKIQYKSSKDIFVLFCALNAMGYDDENNQKGMHPIRKKVRKHLLKYNWEKNYPNLKRITKNYHPYYLIIKTLDKKLISDAYVKNLENFSNEQVVKKLWKESKNTHIKEVKTIFPLFKKQIIDLLKFLRKEDTDLKKLILIVNPLDAYWRGYGFKIGKIAYVIVGPGTKKNQGELLRHELLHILTPKFRIPLRFITQQRIKKLKKMGYDTQKIINQEYIVRSINLLYETEILKQDISKTIKKEQRNFPKIEDVIEIVKIKLKRSAVKSRSL